MTVNNATKFERGAEWRQWDLHIHTPASFHWHGKRFNSDPNSPENRELVDEMINALNKAKPEVFALMDYWTFDGWFALKKRLAEEGAPKLNKTVFPGIELRLAAPTICRLNAHVIFSDKIKDQTLKDFKSMLSLEIINKPLSNDALIEYARKVGEDITNNHYSREEINADDDKALETGLKIAEINCDSYKNAILQVPDGQAIGFMPYDTSDGLAEVKWQKHYAYFLGLFNSSPIFETRNLDLRSAFVGEETSENSKWFNKFQEGLSNIPRLAVSGSDAHRFEGTKGDNDKRGYGDFPSGKATWIKADPTFLGLLQAIKEPAKRSFIGEYPDKLKEIEENKMFFVDRVHIKKEVTSKLPDTWLEGVSVPLNPDLVAIIGNKGNGKSALADVIALLGNSNQKEHFSFLKKNRFKGKSGEPAKHFSAEICWKNDTKLKRNLNDEPLETDVELIRYIPQHHFENLCNEHVSGKSDIFQKELEKVIFDHASESLRLGALDFDQLIDKQESRFRDQLAEYRKELASVNKAIESLENQCQLSIKQKLQEQLDLKTKQIHEHNANKPEHKDKPSDTLTEDQLQVAKNLEENNEQLKNLVQQEQSIKATELQIAQKRGAVQSISDRIRILERQYHLFQTETIDDFKLLGLEQAKVVALSVDDSSLESIKNSCIENEQLNQSLKIKLNEEKQILLKQQVGLKNKLSEPQLQYQQYLKEVEQWNTKLTELTGTEDTPDTLHGLTHRISQLEQIPQQIEEKCARRKELANEIFNVLDAQKNSSRGFI